jgi:hypothetical protein
VEEEAGADHSPPDAAVDAPIDHVDLDSGPEAGGDGGTDVDVRVDAGVGDGPRDDASVDASPDVSETPCNMSLDGMVMSLGTTLPQDLAGVWELCDSNANLAPDISWVLGNKGTVQLDGLYWWRLSSEQLSQSEQQSAAGMYFRVLEGTGNILQFVDADVGTGAGATLAVKYFPTIGVIELASCDGAGTCAPPAARLVSPSR